MLNCGITFTLPINGDTDLAEMNANLGKNLLTLKTKDHDGNLRADRDLVGQRSRSDLEDSRSLWTSVRTYLDASVRISRDVHTDVIRDFCTDVSREVRGKSLESVRTSLPLKDNKKATLAIRGGAGVVGQGVVNAYAA